ncbi:TPA: hypothetical protein MFL87_006219 [Klebsiella pneumoniae]|nr:hypothetical protein [Klebsiella pneumoniae]HBW8393996.1 hypothetical protein [Klebsiella pneumoniae]HBZ3398192.1 hypothetical protein [Klebsiella pneumoniae]
MSVKPAKDSTNQGWFVEYGAVAAPLPVCHPFMPASLSFLLPEDIHIRSAKKKPTFRYGSELLFSRKGGRLREGAESYAKALASDILR